MFTMLESNLGYGASIYTSAASCRGAERDFINQQVPGTLSYSQMLRMSMEESTEDMGSSHDCVMRSNGVYASEEANYMQGSCSECVLRNKGSSEDQMEYNEGAISSLSMKGASNLNVCIREEEGFAENDYGFTCLTLGRGTPPCDRFDVPSSSPQTVSRNTSGFTRTCKLCGTSKTPLWRSGPMGAKSLCNACGIRSNKAKKLSAANEEEEQGAGSWSSKSKGFLKQAASSKVIKRKKAELEAKLQKKKKKKNEAGESDGELAKEEKQKKKKKKKKEKEKRSVLILKQQQQAKLPRLHVNVSMNSTPSTSSPVKTESSSCVTSRGTPSPCSTQRKPFPPISMLSTQVPQACLHFDSMCHFDECAFPKDEEQAAFLLMALSCGFVLA